MREPILRGVRNRALQLLALFGPGAKTLRPRLHRWRGVTIGDNVAIGTDVIIETSKPHLVAIGDDVSISIRTVIIAHFHGSTRADREPFGKPVSVRIGNRVFIGPGSIILPNVTLGDGSVVGAGSVVSRSVPPGVMVRGNPAEPVARCGIPLTRTTSLRDFYRRLQPLRRAEPGQVSTTAPSSTIQQ